MGEKGGFPVEAFLRLYAQKAGKTIPIEKPQDLASLYGIEVKHEGTALRLVRLFTDVHTFFHFSTPGGIEFPHPNAAVRARPDGFEILRTLLVLNENPPFNFDLSQGRHFPVYEIKETLLTNATYTCEKIRLLEWIDEKDTGIRLPK